MSDDTKTAKPAVLKTNLHAIFATDERLEEDGTWLDVNDFYGLKIKIRRLRSDAVLKAFEKIVRETYGEGKLRKPGDLTSDQSNEILRRQLAEAVLIDWEGLRDAETGDDIPYSKETSYQLMGIKDFREFVYQAANERETFREKADKDAAKN
jgi:hypothetical protein